MRLETQQDSVNCILSQTIVFTSNFSGFMQGSPQRYRHFVHNHKCLVDGVPHMIVSGVYIVLYWYFERQQLRFSQCMFAGEGVVHL